MGRLKGPMETPTTALDLDEINLASFDFWLRDDVHGALALLRRHRPVAWHEHPDCGKGFWSLTRLDDVVAVTRDWQTFSSASGVQVIIDVEEAERMPAVGSMLSSDPPKHTNLRAIVNRGFTPRMMDRLEPLVRRRAREIVDAIGPAGEVEFVSRVAAALPMSIIADLMGVPESDRAGLLELTNGLLGGGDPEYGGTKESIVRSAQGLIDYAHRLAQARLDHPEDDLTTKLVQADVGGERLSPEDLAKFFLLLFTAGNETTRHALSHGLWALTRFPEERARWAADLDGLAPTAVEEILRWATPVLHMRRTATRDVDFGGARMRKGDKVAMWYCSANRDEAHFVDPHRFDVTREPNHQSAFGAGGLHFCLGAHLARREVAVMLTELLRCLPDIRVVGEPEKLRSNFAHGIKRMRAAFTPIAR